MGLPPMIKYTSSDELAVVQLDAPPVNAISFAMLEELRGAIARAAGDASVQAIVILGGGMSARLFVDLRERRGLVYSCGSFWSHSALGASGLVVLDLDQWTLPNRIFNHKLVCSVELAQKCQLPGHRTSAICSFCYLRSACPDSRQQIKQVW